MEGLDELRGYGEYRGVLTSDRPKQSQEGLTQLRPHLRDGEQLLLMLRVVRFSSPKSTWLGATSERLLLVNSGTLTFGEAWDDVVLEPLSGGLRVHPDGDKPFKVPVSGAKGAQLEGLLAVCRSCQLGGVHHLPTDGAQGDHHALGATRSADASLQAIRNSQGVGEAKEMSVGTPESDEPTATSVPTVIESLRELADLHGQGVLSDEEFAAMKAKLLGGD